MADDAWYHRPLWSSIVGGLLTLVLIGAGGAIANYFTKGGLVRFLGGTTPETLVADLDNLRGDERA